MLSCFDDLSPMGKEVWLISHASSYSFSLLSSFYILSNNLLNSCTISLHNCVSIPSISTLPFPLFHFDPLFVMRIFPSNVSSYFLIDLGVILTLFGYFSSKNFDIRYVYEVFIIFFFHIINPSESLSIFSLFLFDVSSRIRFYLNYSSYHLHFILSIQVNRKGHFILSFDSSYLLSLQDSFVSSINKPISAFCVVSLSFSFLKFLVYSEQKKLLEYTG